MTTSTAIAAATPERPPSHPSRLLVAGLLAGPLFTAAYLAEGAFRGHGYSPLRHPVSSLGLGPHGWEQIANFGVCGLLVVLFSIGLRRTLRTGPGALAVPLLVAVWGIGLIGAGIFVTDPVGGYPTAASPVTWHGRLHDLAFSLPGFAALTLAMLTATVAFARRRAGWFALYSALSGVAFRGAVRLRGNGLRRHRPVGLRRRAVAAAVRVRRLALARPPCSALPSNGPLNHRSHALSDPMPPWYGPHGGVRGGRWRRPGPRSRPRRCA